MSQKIIIDTDPGQDDAVAILLALVSDELDVLGITCVAGNVPLHLTASNACKILELANLPAVPVYLGSDRPMLRKLRTAEKAHGKTGLDGPELPEPKIEYQPIGAVEFIIASVMASEPKTITLCLLGPLTNIALALRQEPGIASRIKEIVLMGGGFFEGGNVTPCAEFNIYVDPEAAHEVLHSGIPIVMHPLDVTHQVIASFDIIERLKDLNNGPAQATAEMLGFYGRFNNRKYGYSGAPLHDPNVIAYLIAPDLYDGRLINVEVEINSELTLGMTVVDWWSSTVRPKNVFYVNHVDADKFFDLIIDRLGKY
jgi:purine nucleosidase|tara:strand:+ start:2096 stop:3031 length:936 start_codon:yes stop_codon:yes gene_type:complete